METDALFLEYEAFCRSTDYGRILREDKLSEGMKEVWVFIKETVKLLKTSVKDFMVFLKDKGVFKLFTEFKWDLEYFKKVLTQAHNAWVKIVHAVPDLLTSLAHKGIDLALVKMGKDPETLRKVGAEIDAWLKRHKAILVFSGAVFAGLLVLMWMNQSFTGDFHSDFDMSEIVLALTGKLTFATFFTSPAGIKSLILLLAGVASGGALSFPWFGQLGAAGFNLVIAAIHTIAKHVKKSFSKKNSSDADIERDLQTARL